jgi:hypothetical protein
LVFLIDTFNEEPLMQVVLQRSPSSGRKSPFMPCRAANADA